MAELNTTTKLDRLEKQIGVGRTELSATLDDLQRRASGTAGQIRRRVSVKALRTDAGQYVGETANGILASVQNRAFDNPLQAVALGAVLAYPLLGVLKRIPAPVLMLGVGALLARRGGSGSIDSSSHVERSQQVPRLSSAAADVGWSEASRQGAASAGSQILDRGADAGSRLVNEASRWASSSAASVSAAAQRTTDRIGDTGLTGSRGVMRGVQDHPLVAGGIVAFVGAAVAAAIPSTTFEDDLYGDAGDALKARARQGTRDGVETVGAAAGRIIDRTTKAAEDQGLTPSSAKAAAQELGGTLHAIADDAIDDLQSGSSKEQHT